MSFEELHIYDISDSHSSAVEDASILVCDIAVSVQCPTLLNIDGEGATVL
jgi:hypothetical protein